MNGRLDGKAAVVTGAGRGIGKACSELFAREGAAVVVTDIDSKPLDEVVKEIQSAGGKAIGVVGDITKPEDSQKIMDKAVESFHKLDILVNNAGIPMDAMIHKMTDNQWDLCVSVNLTGAFNCIRAAAKYMRQENHDGRIINITSHVGLTGDIGRINYCAAKAGVVGLTKAVAKEWARYGITCNAIAYGFVDTRLTKAKEEQQEVVAGIELGIPKQARDIVLTQLKPMLPEEASKSILLLASDEAAQINGQVLSPPSPR